MEADTISSLTNADQTNEHDVAIAQVEADARVAEAAIAADATTRITEANIEAENERSREWLDRRIAEMEAENNALRSQLETLEQSNRILEATIAVETLTQAAPILEAETEAETIAEAEASAVSLSPLEESPEVTEVSPAVLEDHTRPVERAQRPLVRIV
jgi:hypothetical protein